MQHKIISTISIKSCIEEINNAIQHDFIPTLAFIFTSVNYDLEALNHQLSQYDFLIVGATTEGEIYADELHGVHTKEDTITCMLLNINSKFICLKTFTPQNNKYFDLGMDTSKWALSNFTNPVLITITAGLTFDNESYLQGIQKYVSHIFGAVAADSRKLENTYVFSGKKLISSGSIVLAIDQEHIEIINSLGFGWSGIGSQRVITKSHNNIVYTIDDKPALEFYKNYLHLTHADMPHRGGDYPLEIELSSGQIFYRAPLVMNDKDGSLMFAGHVEENSKVRISAPIGINLVNHIVKNIELSLKPNQLFTSDFTLVFPCASHKKILGSYNDLEIHEVYKAIQKRPLIGFYAYGEISSLSHQDIALNNQSFITLQIKEKIQ